MLQSGPRRLHRGQRAQSTNSPVTNGAALILDEVDESALQERGNELFPLYVAAQNVITQIRLVQANQKR